MNYAQIKAIEAKNKQRILKVCPTATEESGIYIFTREEQEIRRAYIGQAKHLLSRLASHLKGYEYLDNSIRKHKFYSEDNKTGWYIIIIRAPIDRLDEFEKYFIKQYANMGYQLLNKTSGGQDKGKFGIAPNKPPKGYRDGLKQGYINAQRDVRKWVKHLEINFSIEKKLSCSAYAKLQEFIKKENK